MTFYTIRYLSKMKVFSIANVLLFFFLLLQTIRNSECTGEMGQGQITGAASEWDKSQHPSIQHLYNVAFDGPPGAAEAKKRKLEQVKEQNPKQVQPPTGAASEWDYYNGLHPIAQNLYKIIFDGTPGSAAAKKRKLDQLEVQNTKKQQQEESPKKDIVYKRRRKGQKEGKANE